MGNEQTEAQARVDEWKRGWLAGYRGEKREKNQSVQYLQGYRSGVRNRLFEQADIPQISRKRR